MVCCALKNTPPLSPEVARACSERSDSRVEDLTKLIRDHEAEKKPFQASNQFYRNAAIVVIGVTVGAVAALIIPFGGGAIGAVCAANLIPIIGVGVVGVHIGMALFTKSALAGMKMQSIENKIDTTRLRINQILKYDGVIAEFGLKAKKEGVETAIKFLVPILVDLKTEKLFRKDTFETSAELLKRACDKFDRELINANNRLGKSEKSLEMLLKQLGGFPSRIVKGMLNLNSLSKEDLKKLHTLCVKNGYIIGDRTEGAWISGHLHEKEVSEYLSARESFITR